MPPSTEDLQRSTAGDRRRIVVRTLSREFDISDPSSAAARFAILLESGPRTLVMSADVDGLLGATMLAQVEPSWRIGAMIWRSGAIDVHPDFAAQAFPLEGAFGVDIFSPLFDNISNHPQLWGKKKIGRSAAATSAARAYDEVLVDRARTLLFLNPSIWAGIEGSQTSWKRPTAAGYRYPLGSAQLTLALLEAIDRSPKLFDRQHLPLLIAHSDGGLDSFRSYPFNVPLWWSSMAAAVGPASLTEGLYQLAANQRPTELADAVNRLISEGRDNPRHVSKFLDNDWNLKVGRLADVAVVSDWIASLSGWPDPFKGGSAGLPGWVRVASSTGSLRVAGLPPGGEAAFKAGLRSSLGAIHTNFNLFNLQQKLSWVDPWAACMPPHFAPLPADLT